ncbi:MAG: 16S rRNA (cytidine(1402)-2'-O)-methyltransferase [Clostridia bacterium]|nr:16S rRNA (cytidine(1402)-2'-O)-methyltransferase [Clostridia bacterium]
MTQPNSGRLTLVGTPIGNLSDFSPRAIEALEQCDFIAAEDTRVTLKLLNHFGITKPLVSYHEHNKRERGEQLCARLLAGENGVLVSDAGMPAISDPGEDLVALCHRRGIPVGVVPGPTAVTAALALAGLPTGRFTFEGFLSVNKRSRRTHLDSLRGETRTMVFYEAPHKLKYTLCDLLAALGDRRIALVREITKIHEEVIRTTLAAAVARYEEENPRGEFVLIVEGAAPAEKEVATPEVAADLARSYMEEGMSPSEAAKTAAAETGLKKGDIYRLLTAKEE